MSDLQFWLEEEVEVVVLGLLRVVDEGVGEAQDIAVVDVDGHRHGAHHPPRTNGRQFTTF